LRSRKYGLLFLTCFVLAACGQSAPQAEANNRDSQITAGGGKELLPCAKTHPTTCTIDDMGLTLEQYNKKYPHGK
jgi:hypothetical protein